MVRVEQSGASSLKGRVVAIMEGLSWKDWTWEVDSDLVCQSQSGQHGVEDQEGFMLFENPGT